MNPFSVTGMSSHPGLISFRLPTGKRDQRIRKARRKFFYGETSEYPRRITGFCSNLLMNRQHSADLLGINEQEFPRFDDLASHPSLRAFFVGQRKYSGHFAAPEFCERIPSLRRRKIANIQAPDSLGHSCDEFGSAPKKSCLERTAREAVVP
jgi:hypothetical protein